MSSDVIKRQLRSTLLPNKNGLVLNALEEEYFAFFGERIPFQQFGFPDLIAFLYSMPDVVTLQRLRGGDLIVKAKADESTSHIQEMVGMQKDNPEGYNRLTNIILSRPVNRENSHLRNSSTVKAATETCVKTSVDKKDSSSQQNQGLIIPEYLKKNLKVLLDSLSAQNVSTEELYDKYKVQFGEAINVSDFNCSSFIEVLSLLPDLVKLKADKVTRTVLVIPVKCNDTNSKKQMAADGDLREGPCLKSLLPSSDGSSDSKEGSNGDDSDETLEVYITEVKNPDMIFVHNRADAADFEDYISIFESLMSAEDKWDINTKELQVNKKYALKMDGSWYRTKLLSASDSKQVCSVFFLDYGFRRECDKRDLKKLPKTMKGDPYAIPVRLTGLQNNGKKWSKDTIGLLKQILTSATNGSKVSFICKVDYANIAEDNTSIPVRLLTQGGRDINKELRQSIELEKDKEEAVKENVFARIESFLTQLKNVELSVEEESSLEKISLRLEKILQGKEVPPPISVKTGIDPPKKTDAVLKDENANPGKEINEEVNEVHHKVKDLNPTPEVQSIRTTNSKHSLSDVKLWSKASLIPRDGSKGVRLGIGLCYLKRSKSLVVTCMDDKKVKMFTSDGRFLKVVTCAEADDGDLTDPSAVTSLVDGGFAVSDKRRVLVFDEDGKYLKTVWSSDNHSHLQSLTCFGLGQDVQKRLVLLLDSKDQNKTFLGIIDSLRSNMSCFDVRHIVKASPRSNFKFLTVVGHSFFVTDYAHNKVYGLKFSDEGKLVKDLEINGKFLKKPSGVSADSEGNIIVADYTDSGNLAVFSDKGNWLKNIEVSLQIEKKASCLVSLKRLYLRFTGNPAQSTWTPTLWRSTSCAMAAKRGSLNLFPKIEVTITDPARLLT